MTITRNLATRRKDPAARRILVYDYTEQLQPGDSLTGTPTVEVTALSGVTASLTGVLASVSSPRVSVRIASGVDGGNYLVKVLADTAAGDLLALTALIEVREGA